MKIKTCVLVATVLLFTFISCDEDNQLSPTGRDYIVITWVKPSTDLADGVIYDFAVEVEYELASHPQAELMIGFNTNAIGTYAMISSAGEIVYKGRRRSTLNATVAAKDWGTDGDFKVYVNLSPYPRGDSWVPITNDTFELTF